MGRRAKGEEGPVWPLQDKTPVLVLVNREPGIREDVCPAGPRMLLGLPGRGVLTAHPAPPSGGWGWVGSMRGSEPSSSVYRVSHLSSGKPSRLLLLL